MIQLRASAFARHKPMYYLLLAWVAYTVKATKREDRPPPGPAQ
jgi:hypothetical protein